LLDLFWIGDDILSTKIKFLLISLVAALAVFMGLAAVNSRPESLDCSIASITTQPVNGKTEVKIVYEYRWSKIPLRINEDTFKIGWAEGWQIENFTIKINEKDMKNKFYNDFNNKSNQVTIKLDSNANFLHEEICKGEITLVMLQEDEDRLSRLHYSEANLQYTHNGLFSRVMKASAVTWENKNTL
jgi:hypothetical protein